MIDPAELFVNGGRIPCKRCGRLNDFGSSQALFHADLTTPCVYCGFRFLKYLDLQMQKLMEVADKDPEWRKMLQSGPTDLIKQRLDQLVPIPDDKS